jgi:hypothetical protein
MRVRNKKARKKKKEKKKERKKNKQSLRDRHTTSSFLCSFVQLI